MIYIIYPDVDVWNFVLQDIDNGVDIITRPLNRYCYKWQLVFRKAFNNLRSNIYFLCNRQMCKELRSLKQGDTLLVCDYCDLCIEKTLSKAMNPTVKKCLWIWNPINKNQRECFCKISRQIKKENFELSTFDPADSQSFGMKLYNQFFRIVDAVRQPAEEKYDFYFIGYAKNRESEIKELSTKLADYRTFFKIVHNNFEAISYTESVENIRSSKCLVEIVQSGQSGMTLRPLEALAYHKKLITNNTDIIKCDFYCPQNIFIIGQDNFSDVELFLNTPMKEIANDIRSRYDVYTWIKHFKEINN